MSWNPFRRERTAPKPSLDAARASEEADRQLERARAFRIDAHEVSLRLQQSNNSNHFAESFERAMRGTA